jgi:hypothetical protein
VKRALLKVIFVITVIFFMLIALIPATAALDLILPSVRGADGLHHSADRLFPGGIVIFMCLWIADRFASRFFRAARLSDERWSIFKTRRSRSFR